MEWLSRQLDLYLDILRFLAPAIPMTLKVTLLAFVLALLGGMIISLIRISGFAPLRFLGRAYVDVIRGVPLLVQIFFIYFGLGKILNLDRFLAGVIAVGICYSAYLAEIIRAGIQSVGKGQYEAALSLGMSFPQTMRHIIFPQALRVIIPPTANEFVACLKDSSLVSIIGLRELTRAGREYYSQYFVDFHTWFMVAIIYFILTYGLTRMFYWLERKYKVLGYEVAH
ncbi:MAG: amino acid ABC transporter permease [candidate division Zixibacteria bacterium]|nr:amino acid ABC transporter permease [candidate division Zixibacteria bacterium]